MKPETYSRREKGGAALLRRTLPRNSAIPKWRRFDLVLHKWRTLDVSHVIALLESERKAGKLIPVRATVLDGVFAPC